MTTTAPHPSPALDPALVSRLAALVTAAPDRSRQTSYAPFTGDVVG